VASLPARDRLEAFAEAPDLVATVQVVGTPDNKVPIVTFLTLGIIPTVGKGYDGVRVTLAAPATGRTLEIRIDQKDLVIIGWGGAVLLARRSGFARAPITDGCSTASPASSPPAPRPSRRCRCASRWHWACSFRSQRVAHACRAPPRAGRARRARRGESGGRSGPARAGMNREQNAPGAAGPKDSGVVQRGAQPTPPRSGPATATATRPRRRPASSCRAPRAGSSPARRRRAHHRRVLVVLALFAGVVIPARGAATARAAAARTAATAAAAESRLRVSRRHHQFIFLPRMA